MCLLKAYVERDGKRELIASDVAFIYVKDGEVRLKKLKDLEELVLENVRLTALDALNSIVIFESR
ncbi:MAG: hypothetical protein DRO05_05130 [Thermoproteota archaeon]|nr:MAG: hypothetical protein DRO05_05130 [Candidatus Korarchaeota archaeon]